VALEIHKSRVRNALKPRREPYWAAQVARGRYLGFRKIDEQRGSWVARLRDDEGIQHYRALGALSPTLGYEQALAAAVAWFAAHDAGVRANARVTVQGACQQYVEDRRREKGEATARDAEARFERTIEGTEFGRTLLEKITTPQVRRWRDGLELSKASANRTLTALKAALNLAVRNRLVPAARAIEWRDVKPYPNAGKRRTLFLDLEQRRGLIAACEGALRDLVEAAALTGARPGEIVRAVRSQFDARTASMTFIGKTGTRTVPLSAPAVALFTRLARSRTPRALLLTRDDGQPWAHSDWDELVRAAAQRAGLPTGTVLYTLRHSFITQAVMAGMTTLDVARLVGTSVMMIEKHYGHLVASSARERLDRVEIL
jgi:integrase